MKIWRLAFLQLFPLVLQAQISAVDAGKGGENNNVTDIVVVFKMHFDIGYTEWAGAVLQKYAGPMLDKTLRYIDQTSSLPKNERFVWTVPGWPLHYMLDNCSPENKIRLEKAIKDQRIIPHALPFTLETEASDMENLTRGLSFTDNINRRWGLKPARDAKFTDVPEHSWVIPTLLKNAGVDVLHIGCNPGSASPAVPTLFWWQGPDSSRLLTFYWDKYYGSGILPPKDWPYKTWLAMIMTHENTGAPDPELVAGLIKEARQKMPNARVHIGRIADFYDLLMKEKPNLPVIRGDMPDTWIHGFMSAPEDVKTNKIFQRETYVAEQLNAHMNIWKGKHVSIDKYVDKAAENMLLFDEHTFGAALSHGNQPYWKYGDDFEINKAEGNYYFLEKSWEEKSAYPRTAEKIMWPLKRNLLFELVKSVKNKERHVTVYNPLPWPRHGHVTLFQSFYETPLHEAPVIAALKDPGTGQLIPVYQDRNLLSFDATEIPAGGYKTFEVVDNPGELSSSLLHDEQNQTMENKFFRLTIDPHTGTLQSIRDKVNDRELVNSKSKYGFGEYVYERLGQDQIDAYDSNYIKPGNVDWAAQEFIRWKVPNQHNIRYTGSCDRIEWLSNKSMIRATALCRLNDSTAQRYLVTYTLYENEPYIEITMGLNGKRPVPDPESGWVAFPFSLDKPEYRLLRTGGVVDPQRDLVNGANHDFYFLNTAMAMYDSSGGIGLNCPHTPGVSIDQPGIGVYSRSRTLTSGTVLSNLYNNVWGTNFTEWIEGSHAAKFYVWSYKNYNAESTFVTPAEETRTPLSAAYYAPTGLSFAYNYDTNGDLPDTQGGLMLDRKGILVTSFNTHGNEAMIRLWEEAGNSGKCTVTLPQHSQFKLAYPCNLRGEGTANAAGIPVSMNSFVFEIGPNQPRTFLLK
ncbi:glycoside hydrolase family 38 C-terminal domain-containing protein [Flavitalea sp. BT771]|uniref:glycoside hydrolase family 38 C-terminal domain-containing protein n=1 Tax=Flavitalea sp. BT771 TaxID=3063329 RepID=UPI0026E32378|nr:glycoside hydrolase family 38 C-terminal domain-containing protein [Flavitalea sp. BT771]MDO6432192.1 glycoside hydrolase family 38 C-terminal domain-containing protein [Flavitalea sp. BT771]MDV6221102.1 glycoside hydrolase family 38 C-terminal domain-containing protein [Flavitalea sp. BT771]